MGDLVHKGDSEGLERADRNVDKALLDATSAVHEYQHHVWRETTGRMIREAKALEDDTHYQMTALHVEATSEQLGRKTLDIASRATDDMERRANDWKLRRK